MRAPIRPLTVFAEVDSTQRQAQRLRDSQTWTDKGVLFHVCADFQHAGQGRFTRSWEAPAGSSSLVSSVVRIPRVAVAQSQWLTVLAALAVRDAICGVLPHAAGDLRLSWPNDVLLGGKKVAGVLASVLPGQFGAPTDVVDIVVGAGINVVVPADRLPTPRAVSLSVYEASRAQLGGEVPSGQAGCVPTVDAVRKAYAACVERRVVDFVASGCDLSRVREEFLSVLDGVGRQVSAGRMGASSVKSVCGVFVGVDMDGSALVETASGVRSLSSADMSFSEEDK